MQSEKFPLVFAGHVDHGKSTIIGRLLSETGSLPEGKLEAIKITANSIRVLLNTPFSLTRSRTSSRRE